MNKKQFLNLKKGDVLKKKTTGEVMTVDNFYIEGTQVKKYVVCAGSPLKAFFIRENIAADFKIVK